MPSKAVSTVASVSALGTAHLPRRRRVGDVQRGGRRGRRRRAVRVGRRRRVRGRRAIPPPAMTGSAAAATSQVSGPRSRVPVSRLSVVELGGHDVLQESAATSRGRPAGGRQPGSDAPQSSRAARRRVLGLLPSLDPSCPARPAIFRSRSVQLLAGTVQPDARGVGGDVEDGRDLGAASAAPTPTGGAARRRRERDERRDLVGVGGVGPSVSGVGWSGGQRRLRSRGRPAWRRADRSALRRQLRATPYAQGSGSSGQVARPGASRPAGSRRGRPRRSPDRYAGPGSAAAARSARRAPPRSGSRLTLVHASSLTQPSRVRRFTVARSGSRTVADGATPDRATDLDRRPETPTRPPPERPGPADAGAVLVRLGDSEVHAAHAAHAAVAAAHGRQPSPACRRRRPRW